MHSESTIVKETNHSLCEFGGIRTGKPCTLLMHQKSGRTLMTNNRLPRCHVVQKLCGYAPCRRANPRNNRDVSRREIAREIIQAAGSNNYLTLNSQFFCRLTASFRVLPSDGPTCEQQNALRTIRSNLRKSHN